MAGFAQRKLSEMIFEVFRLSFFAERTGKFIICIRCLFWNQGGTISSKWKCIACCIAWVSLYSWLAFRAWNSPQPVWGHLSHSSFGISLLSQHLPINFRTHSVQHLLCLQNSPQTLQKGRCLEKLAEVHFTVGGKGPLLLQTIIIAPTYFIQ